MLLSLNADTQGLFKKNGEKNLFQDWKLACPADNHTVLFFLLPCPFAARIGKLHSPGFWAAALSGGYLKMDPYFHYTPYTGFYPSCCFCLLFIHSAQKQDRGPSTADLVPKELCLSRKCPGRAALPLLPAHSPAPLLPLGVNAWHSTAPSASLPKLAASSQGQQSPLCTSLKWGFFNSSEHLQWLNQFVPGWIWLIKQFRSSASSAHPYTNLHRNTGSDFPLALLVITKLFIPFWVDN